MRIEKRNNTKERSIEDLNVGDIFRFANDYLCERLYVVIGQTNSLLAKEYRSKIAENGQLIDLSKNGVVCLNLITSDLCLIPYNEKVIRQNVLLTTEDEKEE